MTESNGGPVAPDGDGRGPASGPQWAPLSSAGHDGPRHAAKAGDGSGEPVAATGATVPSADPAPEPASADSADAGEVAEPEHPDKATNAVAAWLAKQPRWFLPAAIGVLVIVIAAIVTAIVVLTGGKGQQDPAAQSSIVTTASAVTVTASAPAATQEPVDRGEGTALFAAIPDRAGALVLTELVADPQPVSQNAAIEAYTATYTGPDAAGETITFTVTIAQWATTEAAAPFIASYEPASGATESQTGDVLVDGAVVGTFQLDTPPAGSDGVITGDGSGQWSNQTVVIRASGPAAHLPEFYNQYAW